MRTNAVVVPVMCATSENEINNEKIGGEAGQVLYDKKAKLKNLGKFPFSMSDMMMKIYFISMYYVQKLFNKVFNINTSFGLDFVC